tara:strand:+ start:12762 stop:14060 length:1299 start_codon:yes stop_codon:yes gene_type:complete
MALPPWTIELLRRGLTDVARKAGDAETLDKLKQQATEILQDLPQTAARGIDAVMRSADAGKKSVQRWSRKHTAIAVPVLNASGTLQHLFGDGVPICDEAISAGVDIMRGDCVSGPAASERMLRRLQRNLPVGGDYSIAIANNFPAALTAFSMLVEHRSIVVHRSHAVRLPGGVPLPEAFGTLLPVVQEVGGVEKATTDDFDGFESFCVVWADGGTYPVEILDFGDRDAIQAVVLPVATFTRTAHEEIPSVEAILTQGADVVMINGGGVCGGPECGLLVGRQEIIQAITDSPVWPALQANEATQTMMSVAIETAAASADNIPVLALLDTNEENLRARAERMATRLSGSDLIQHCHVAAEEARITANGRWRLPSRQVRLRHQSWSAEKWSEDLREEIPSVIARVDGEELVVDLRWIAAADDSKLAALLAGESEE